MKMRNLLIVLMVALAFQHAHAEIKNQNIGKADFRSSVDLYYKTIFVDQNKSFYVDDEGHFGFFEILNKSSNVSLRVSAVVEKDKVYFHNCHVRFSGFNENYQYSAENHDYQMNCARRFVTTSLILSESNQDLVDSLYQRLFVQRNAPQSDSSHNFWKLGGTKETVLCKQIDDCLGESDKDITKLAETAKTHEESAAKYAKFALQDPRGSVAWNKLALEAKKQADAARQMAQKLTQNKTALQQQRVQSDALAKESLVKMVRHPARGFSFNGIMILVNDYYADQDVFQGAIVDTKTNQLIQVEDVFGKAKIDSKEPVIDLSPRATDLETEEVRKVFIRTFIEKALYLL
jgi:hypothetical protein